MGGLPSNRDIQVAGFPSLLPCCRFSRHHLKQTAFLLITPYPHPSGWGIERLLGRSCCAAVAHKLALQWALVRRTLSRQPRVKTMKRLLLLALLAASPSWAAPIDDARAANAKGDYATELRIVRPLAAQGEAWAQLRLGFMYHKGEGVVQDHAEAVRLYKLAAAQGNAGAQSNLGFMYHKGEGVVQDHAEAVRLYKLAAAQGNASAQHNLGLMYVKGDGVVQDYAEAVRLYKLAAAQGSARAKKTLSDLYDKCSQMGLGACEGKANVAASNAGSSTPARQPLQEKLTLSELIVKQQKERAKRGDAEEKGLSGNADRKASPAVVAASNAGSSTPARQSISNQTDRKASQAVLADSDPILGLAQYEKYCIELGFKKKTPEYGICVLDLSRRAETLTAANVKSSVAVQAQQSQSPDILPAAPSGDGTADDLSCQGYGYKVSTNEYAGCRLNLRQANEENERREREYNFEKQRYERELKSSNEAERRRKAKCHFASSAEAGRSGSTTLQAFTNYLACEGGADAPVAVAPNPPPTIHCTFNGNSMTCR